MKWLYVILVFVPVRSHYVNETKSHENVLRSPCTEDDNHYFLAPGVLTAGGTNRACLSRFYPEGSARMLLTLQAEDKQTYTASRELPPGDGGCLDIPVPLLPNTKADLKVTLWYKEAKCVWERKISVRIASGRVVVVHTERARYRPGETMKARVFALKADLTPSPGNIEEIWLEGPPGAWEGTRVAEWQKVRSKLGLAQVQHEIDELAPTGRWTVRVRLADGSQGSAFFWVGNYELPPFQLTVRHAPKVLRTSERLVWTVCVRYPWSEAVEGMLVIRLRSLGGSTSSSGVRTAARVRGRACHRHAAAASRLGLNTAAIVGAHFSFQEEGTRIWQNTTVVSQVVDRPITLEFLTKPTTVISPGLPYKLKVKATRWDDKPAPNTRVIVCRSSDDKNKSCVSGDSDVTGVARVMFAAGEDGSKKYTFQAHLSNDTTVTTGPLTLSTRNSTIQAALGPLKADPHSRTFVPLYLSLQNVTTAVTVHFVVITRGGIIYRWGATTQCPIASSATYIQTANRNTKCDDPMPQYDKDNENNIDNDDRNNNINRNYGNSNPYVKNRSNYVDRVNSDYKRRRSNTNQYVNDNKNNQNRENTNKISDYIIRNMNEFDINSYLHKNAHDKYNIDKNATVFDRYSSVIVKNHINDKTNDVNSVQYEANDSDALLDRHLLRVMLPIKVTQQMCPDSHLIAYFYYNGEFVSASKHFEMDDCFVNKVEISFQPRQILPGSTATLQLSTPGPALCALTAIDVAAKWGTKTVRDVLIERLRTMIDGHRNITEFDAGDCTVEVQQLNHKQITASWLASAGVVTGDTFPKSCDSPAQLLDTDTPRTDFSEAWLWRLVTVGNDGAATVTATAPDSITRYEANAVCLSKTGIAISQPAVLQVFREFFIHADCPKRLRHGDSTILRYRIFNYLYEPLTVQVEILTSHHLGGPAESVETIRIAGRSPAARRVVLAARARGAARVAVRAAPRGNHTAGRGRSDEVVMQITVDPEGMPVEEHKSILLCGKDNNTKSEIEWNWSLITAVPGTETLNVWLTGNLLGPLLADSDALVQIPRGCGEQNMARLATNLLALQHLDPHCSAALVARQHVAKGYTRQLQYIHPTGGFSAFGASDVTPSTWLTAFSLKYMKKAHQLLWPEQPIPPSLTRAEEWLRDQQMENGCFRNEGQVFHRELRGGLNEEGELASISLTSYVITALLDSSLTLTLSPSSHSTLSHSPLSSKLIRNTLSCLRALPPIKHKTPSRVYAHALRAYALMRLKMYEDQLRSYNEAKYEDLRAEAKGEMLKENEALLELLDLIKMARTDGDYMWWETSSLSTSIEATSYALLAMQCSTVEEWGAGAVHWLSAHRTTTGGFVSTQDTLVALEALAIWSSSQPSSANLTVTIKNGSVTKNATILPQHKIPEILKMGNGDRLDVSVEGKGCALIQATKSYNSLTSGVTGPPVGPRGGLAVTVTVHTDGAFDCDNVTSTCYCAAIIEACAVWSRSFPDMALLEVSLPGGYAADAHRLYSQLQLRDTLLRRIELPPSGTRATLYLGSPGVPLPPRGHACYNIHAVGPRAPTRPAYVKIMDYYTPEINDTQFYTIPEDCPSRVTHESTQDFTLDNIFTKARSLSDDGEVLITQEYTFEDIPEGIPLEDPLYENLRESDIIKVNNTDFIESNSYKVGKTDANTVEDDNESLYEMPKKENGVIEVNNTGFKDDTEPLGDSLYGNKEQKGESKINNTDLNDDFNMKARVDEMNRKFINTRRNLVDDKLDFISSTLSNKPVKSYRTKKILNRSDKHEELPNEYLINKDKITTNQEPKETTHENIKENTNNIKITTESPVTEFNNKVVKDDDNVENPNLSNFHVINSEKDLEVPSGIEGPVTEIVLPPDNFKYQDIHDNIETNGADTKEFGNKQNFGPTRNFGPTQNFGTLKSSQNFMPMQNFEETQIYPTQNFGITENFRTLQNRPLQNSESTHNLARKQFQLSQYIRPTENFRPTQSVRTQNFRDTQDYSPESFAAMSFKFPQNFSPSENVRKAVNFNLDEQNVRLTENFKATSSFFPPTSRLVQSHQSYGSNENQYRKNILFRPF